MTPFVSCMATGDAATNPSTDRQHGWAHAHERHRALKAAHFRDWLLQHARALTSGDRVKVQPFSNSFVILRCTTFPPLSPECLPLLPVTQPLWLVPQQHLLWWGSSAASPPGAGIKANTSVCMKPPDKRMIYFWHFPSEFSEFSRGNVEITGMDKILGNLLLNIYHMH